MIPRRWVGSYNQVGYSDMDAANKCRAEVTLSDAVMRDHGPKVVLYPCVVCQGSMAAVGWVQLE